MNKTLRLTISIYLISFLPISLLIIMFYIFNGANVFSIIWKELLFTVIMFIFLLLYVNSFLKLNGYAYENNSFMNMSSGTKYEVKDLEKIKKNQFILYYSITLYFVNKKKINVSFNNKDELELFLINNDLAGKVYEKNK